MLTAKIAELLASITDADKALEVLGVLFVMHESDNTDEGCALLFAAMNVASNLYMSL